MKYKLLLLTILFLSCKTKSISLLLLEKHSGKSIIAQKIVNEELVYTYGYSEVFLIDNLPNRLNEEGFDESIYNILEKCLKKNNKICLLEDDVLSYSMVFLRRTSCTEYFIDNKQDHTGMFQTTFDDCKGDGEYSFYYERDENNPNMWTNTVVAKYWDKKYRDTIYCEPNHKKIKLPNMPIR